MSEINGIKYQNINTDILHAYMSLEVYHYMYNYFYSTKIGVDVLARNFS